MGAYGGKSYYQESVDSRAALGLVLIALALALLGISGLVIAWLVL